MAQKAIPSVVKELNVFQKPLIILSLRTCSRVETSRMFVFVLDDESEDLEDRDTYKAMHARDQRRFKMADKDGDGIATREEFTAFLHPEDFDYMRAVVVQVRGRVEPCYHGNHIISVHHCYQLSTSSPSHGRSLRLSQQETMEDIDKNGDGKVNLEEYIGELGRERSPAVYECECVTGCWVFCRRHVHS